MRHEFLLSILVAGIAPFTMDASIIVTLDSPSEIDVAPGGASGWGFNIQEDDGWVVPTSSFFVPDSPFGNYTDFISLPQNYFVVPPAGVLDVPFDAASQQGVGEFFVLPSTPPGTEIDGTLLLFYDLYFTDPRIFPLLDQGGLLFSADVSIQVTTPASDPETPEPATLPLVAVGALGCVAARRRRKVR
jgi:hypothetical protein